MLYQNEGIYRYTAGVNWRAALTLLIVVPINLPGLIHAINDDVEIGNYSFFYRASWLTSFFISFGLYVLISKVFPPTSTLVDKTVESLDEDAGYPGIMPGESDAVPKGWEKEMSPTTSTGGHSHDNTYNLSKA